MLKSIKKTKTVFKPLDNVVETSKNAFFQVWARFYIRRIIKKEKEKDYQILNHLYKPAILFVEFGTFKIIISPHNSLINLLTN